MLRQLTIRRQLIAAPLIFLTVNVVADEKPSAGEKKKPAKTGQAIFDGKTLKNWRIIKKIDFEKHGKVTVDAKSKSVVLEKGSPATGISWTGKMPRSQYEVSLETKRVAGSDFFCGMTFPVGKEYCSLIIGGGGGGVTGLSNIDGQAAIENETTDYIEFKDNQWYRVRLRVTDKKIEAWVDKKQIVDVDRKDRKFSIWWEQEPVRPFGVATWYTKAAVRDIRLRKLNP